MKPKWKDEEIREALDICDLVDRRWEEYAAEREKALRDTAPLASVWPQAVVIPGKAVEGYRTPIKVTTAVRGSIINP